MFDEKIDEISAKIRVLEDELIAEFVKREDEFLSRIDKEKANFEETVLQNGKSKFRRSIRYLSSQPISVTLTIPLIWAMIIPIMLTDLMTTLYQIICFPIYKIPKVKRKDYVVIDRYKLFYLGRVERINCLYCEYFNGVIAYVREVGGRTEQFWCPIKHSKLPKDTHLRYRNFFDYGDYLKYKEELSHRRKDFKDINS